MSELVAGTVEAFDPEYYSNVYKQIQDIILSCYLDYYIMEFYKRQDEETQREQSQHPILYHIIDLVKRDMCLNLWKICYDDDPDASSLNKLNAYLRKHRKESSYEKSAYWKALEGQIIEARNKYVAHSDVNRVTNKISVESMKHLLADSKNALNGLCIEEYGVKKITDEALSFLDLRTTIDAVSILHSDKGREGI